VHDATLSELSRGGFGGLTIEGVALAAGVSRSTIYRRWPSRMHLVAALLAPQLAHLDEEPEGAHGSAAVVALVRRLAENLTAPEGRALVGVMLSQRGELETLAVEARARALGRFEAALTGARDRGELRDPTDVAMTAHLLFFGTVQWFWGRDAWCEADCLRLVRPFLVEGAIAR
jgi:AcrR family transcriptional regulator